MSVANIEVVNKTINSVFPNTSENDMAIFPGSSTQNIHLGCATGVNSALIVNSSNVQVPSGIFYSPGSVVQVRHAKNATAFSTTSSATWVASPLTITITPKFASSLLLVVANVAAEHHNGGSGVRNTGGLYQIRRDGVQDTVTYPNTEYNNAFSMVEAAPSSTAYVQNYAKVPVVTSFTAGSTAATTFTVHVRAGASSTLTMHTYSRSDTLVYEIAQ